MVFYVFAILTVISGLLLLTATKNKANHEKSFTERYAAYKRYKHGEYKPTKVEGIPEPIIHKKPVIKTAPVSLGKIEIKPVLMDEILLKVETKEVIKEKPAPKVYSAKEVMSQNANDVKVRSMKEILFQLKDENFYETVINLLDDIKNLKKEQHILNDAYNNYNLKNIDEIYLPKSLNLYLDAMEQHNKRAYLDEAEKAAIKILTIEQLDVLAEEIIKMKKFITEQQLHLMKVNHKFLTTKFNPNENEKTLGVYDEV